MSFMRKLYGMELHEETLKIAKMKLYEMPKVCKYYISIVPIDHSREIRNLTYFELPRSILAFTRRLNKFAKMELQ